MNNGLAVLGHNPKSTPAGQTHFHTNYISGNVLISFLYILTILQACSHHVNSVYDTYRGSVHQKQLAKKTQQHWLCVSNLLLVTERFIVNGRVNCAR